MREAILNMIRDPISLAGAVITTVSAVLILTLLGIELVGHPGSPYIGILAFLVLPAFFMVGLVLIPVGLWRERRKIRRGAAPPEGFPIIDLNKSRTRVVALAFLGATVVNVVILAVATYKGVAVMDSTAFCGTACHTVMKPEYTAYQRSPHARVKCVECHIGSGADWFVKSKLSGAWQLVSVSLDLYPKPIPTPVHNLRPARETCEQCHWPSKFVGERLRVKTHFSDDEKAAELKTVLLMNVGGVLPSGGRGIHWHIDPSLRIRYRSDATRTDIGDVELRGPDGKVELFRKEGPASSAEWRTMDCVDCHNRPTHVYGTPEGEVDEALAHGLIDRELPFVRREGVRLVQGDWASEEDARAKIGLELGRFYAEGHPEVAASKQEAIDAAAGQLAKRWSYNVFPEMNVKWGNYPTFLGHEPGCFRCHAGDHKTDSGRTLSKSCNLCHRVLAENEENPEILEQLGAR